MQEIVGHPNLDPELRTCSDDAFAAVPVVLAAAAGLRHDNSLHQVYALALHGTIIELFSACVLLAQWSEPTAIPILLRSIHEALVDLDNLLQDHSYLERMEAAGHKQTLKIMQGGPLREAFKEGRKVDFQEIDTRLAALKVKHKEPLGFKDRCDRAGRLDEYESLYGLFCLDAHNNTPALAERHVSEQADDTLRISHFGQYDPLAVCRRLDFAMQFLFQSARMIHKAFQVPAPNVDALAARFEDGRRRRSDQTVS